ncbi:hypothetical protein [Oscillatoria sp. FACHB-1406]|uniref:hypothetical protein n=1 Tax=Oscillatoria sp. FACHB-1406 TaxID=2692846 RepID=UPI0016875968|nr:hypothetical protein [Oscillatoria sp. FACHB-1406]MBD2578407.1 hypothetical protein [Oscillatoria sp. FACHB-1406]
MVNGSERYRQKQYYLDLLHQAIAKHKLKIWSGMFLSVTIIGALALVGLLDPGFDPSDLQHNSSSTALDATSSTSTPPPNQTAVQPEHQATGAKWLLVLLASTTGGWFITYKLKHAGEAPNPNRQRVKRKVRSKQKSNTSLPPQPKKRHSPPLVSSQTSARVPRNLLAEPVRPPVRPHPAQRPQLNGYSQRAVTWQPAPASHVRARLPAQPSKPVSFRTRGSGEEPQVSVVPAETVMPLDRREPGLAEMLDLRKRRTITSIMGEMNDVE